MVTVEATRGRSRGRDQFSEFLRIVIESVEVLEDNDQQLLEAVSDDQRFSASSVRRSLTGCRECRSRVLPTASRSFFQLLP